MPKIVVTTLQGVERVQEIEAVHGERVPAEEPAHIRQNRILLAEWKQTDWLSSVPVECKYDKDKRTMVEEKIEWSISLLKEKINYPVERFQLLLLERTDKLYELINLVNREIIQARVERKIKVWKNLEEKVKENISLEKTYCWGRLKLKEARFIYLDKTLNFDANLNSVAKQYSSYLSFKSALAPKESELEKLVDFDEWLSATISILEEALAEKKARLATNEAAYSELKNAISLAKIADYVDNLPFLENRYQRLTENMLLSPTEFENLILAIKKEIFDPSIFELQQEIEQTAHLFGKKLVQLEEGGEASWGDVTIQYENGHIIFGGVSVQDNNAIFKQDIELEYGKFAVVEELSTDKALLLKLRNDIYREMAVVDKALEHKQETAKLNQQSLGEFYKKHFPITYESTFLEELVNSEVIRYTEKFSRYVKYTSDINFKTLLDKAEKKLEQLFLSLLKQWLYECQPQLQALTQTLSVGERHHIRGEGSDSVYFVHTIHGIIGFSGDEKGAIILQLDANGKQAINDNFLSYFSLEEVKKMQRGLIQWQNKASDPAKLDINKMTEENKKLRDNILKHFFLNLLKQLLYECQPQLQALTQTLLVGKRHHVSGISRGSIYFVHTTPGVISLSGYDKEAIVLQIDANGKHVINDNFISHFSLEEVKGIQQGLIQWQNEVSDPTTIGINNMTQENKRLRYSILDIWEEGKAFATELWHYAEIFPEKERCLFYEAYEELIERVVRNCSIKIPTPIFRWTLNYKKQEFLEELQLKINKALLAPQLILAVWCKDEVFNEAFSYAEQRLVKSIDRAAVFQQLEQQSAKQLEQQAALQLAQSTQQLEEQPASQLTLSVQPLVEQSAHSFSDVVNYYEPIARSDFSCLSIPSGARKTLDKFYFKLIDAILENMQLKEFTYLPTEEFLKKMNQPRFFFLRKVQAKAQQQSRKVVQNFGSNLGRLAYYHVLVYNSPPPSPPSESANNNNKAEEKSLMSSLWKRFTYGGGSPPRSPRS